jgi:hypothetical protein
MTTASLIPIAGAAAGALASGAAKSLSGGLSFLAALTSGGETAASSSTAESAAASTEELRAEFTRALQDFVARLKQRLTMAGIDVDQPLELEQEPWGSIAAGNDHSQHSQIEAVLGADPLLAAEFHDLAAQYEQLAAAETGDTSRRNRFQLKLAGEETAAGFVQ